MTEGLGLGLSISKQSSVSTAAGIHAENEGLRHGAKFVVQLPAAAAGPEKERVRQAK